MAEDEVSTNALDQKLTMFWTWNGERPAPQFTHWTNRGTFMIRACTPGRPATNEVLFNGTRLGFGAYPLNDAMNLYRGSYDKELGFPASQLVPPTLDAWNGLGG